MIHPSHIRSDKGSKGRVFVVVGLSVLKERKVVRKRRLGVGEDETDCGVGEGDGEGEGKEEGLLGV